uniref:ADAM 17-like protease n=1 Tax=Magallana gigas TaxID=29159 RepID=K1Q1B8_MAGGI
MRSVVFCLVMVVTLVNVTNDDDSSHVEAHWEDGVLSASITTADDIIVIEIGIMNRVNQIFMGTKWPDDNSNIQGLGFEIAEVFSRGSAFKDYCLAHLFTYHRFSRGVLGLAYIAGRENSQPGGICSTGPSPGKVFQSQGYETTFNTGWSSAQNSEGDRVLSLEAALVIAHGHNWGSEHDPDTPGCAPGVEKGGKYLMYPYSVSGYEHNNQDKKREKRLRMRHGRWKSHSSRPFIFQRYTLLMDCLDAEDRQRIKQAGSFRVKHVGGSVIRHSAIRAGHMYLTQSNFTKEVLQYADDLKESSV